MRNVSCANTSPITPNTGAASHATCHGHPLNPGLSPTQSGHSSIQNGLSSIGSSLNLAYWIKSVWLTENLHETLNPTSCHLPAPTRDGNYACG
jgi:hypothetical protein